MVLAGIIDALPELYPGRAWSRAFRDVRDEAIQCMRVQAPLSSMIVLSVSGARSAFFIFLPRRTPPNLPIVMALHGFDRAASDFRDCLMNPAEALQFALLVPEFDNEAFPGAYAYNYGNVQTPAPGTAVLPREQRTFSLIDRLFDHVRAEIGSTSQAFHLFRNSAGAQYVLRYLALTEGNFIGGAVAANSGWYMLPDLNVEYPEGMGGIGLDASFQRRYLAAKLQILLDEADTDSEAADLPRNDVAVSQGWHRLARGLWYFEHCRKLADGLGSLSAGHWK